jgi:hypothetical protein
MPACSAASKRDKFSSALNVFPEGREINLITKYPI